MNIAAVRVEGAKVTRSSFLGFLINPQLAASSANDTPSTLESVLHTTRKMAHTLQKTDMFHSVEAKLERARDELANEGDVDIVFKTREKGRFYLNTSTELGNNEGNAVRLTRFYVCMLLTRPVVGCDWSRSKRVWRRRSIRSQLIVRHKDEEVIPRLVDRSCDPRPRNICGIDRIRTRKR